MVKIPVCSIKVVHSHQTLVVTPIEHSISQSLALVLTVPAGAPEIILCRTSTTAI
jgi:mRNA degradation ribonuclease J1/J2